MKIAVPTIVTDDDACGQDPVEPDTFWVNPLGVSWPLIKRSDLVRLDDTGKVIDHGPSKLVNQSAFLIHAAGK